MKFFRRVKIPEAHARVEWCRANLGKDIIGGNWWRYRGHIYFKDEQSFFMYTLRWS